MTRRAHASVAGCGALRSMGVTGDMSVIRTYLATVFLLIPSLAAMLLSESPRACITLISS